MLGNKEVSSKNGAGCSRRLRLAEVVLEMVTGEEVGGCLEMEEGVSLGLFCLNTVEARGRPGGLHRALPRNLCLSYTSCVNHLLFT